MKPGPKKGFIPKNFKEFQKKGWEATKGRTPTNWKGEKASYISIHGWVVYHKGQPNKCEQCSTTESKKFEWANISGKYKRDLNDYRRLCASCHRKEGFNRGEYVTWNKGKKTGLVPRTAFKKGHIPWNKKHESSNI